MDSIVFYQKLMKRILIFFIFFALHYFPRCYSMGMNEEIASVMSKYHSIGLSVAVVKNNRICYTSSFGYNPDYSDTTKRNPIPENGVYVIQSISKTFVSTAIMQLVERKLVKLDDDVNKYLAFIVRNPKYPDIPITIKMLLAHYSSLNDSKYGWHLRQINPATNDKYQECYNGYPPGAEFAYCNLAYSLLGAIVENVTGKRFYDYIDENITMPLGLRASYDLTKIDSTLIVKAYIYDQKKQKYVMDNSIYNYQFFRDAKKNYKLGYSAACFSPTGGMKISVVDLAKYMMMHMNYGTYNGVKILSKESELEMWKQIGTHKWRYGLAFSRYGGMVEDYEPIGMTGGSHGIHSGMFFNPEEKYGFVIICNGCTSKSSVGFDMSREIVRILYKHLIK